MSTVNYSPVLYAAGQTLRSAGSLAVYAMKTPCVREGLMMAGSAHAARHYFAGPFSGLVTLVGESAILLATGYGSLPSIALGVSFYFLPQGIELFAQKAISKVGFVALNTLGQAGWHMACKGAGLTALGVGQACKGIYTLCQSRHPSQQAAPAIVGPIQDPQRDIQEQTTQILDELVKIRNELLELKKEVAPDLIVRLDALIVRVDALIVKLKEIVSYFSSVKKTSSREGVAATTARQAKKIHNIRTQLTTTPRRSSRITRAVSYK